MMINAITFQLLGKMERFDPSASKNLEAEEQINKSEICETIISYHL